MDIFRKMTMQIGRSYLKGDVELFYSYVACHNIDNKGNLLYSKIFSKWCPSRSLSLFHPQTLLFFYFSQRS